MTDNQVRHLTRDLVIVWFSVLLAVILMRLGLIHQLVEATRSFEFLTEFIAGILFTSTFTTPLAIATFLELGDYGFHPLLTALIGGAGAVLGDYLIYLFVKDDLTEDLLALVKPFKRTFLGQLLKSRLFYWLTPIVAALIIASPVPDELGVSLLGAIKLDRRIFLLVSYSFNTLGILAVLLVGRL